MSIARVQVATNIFSEPIPGVIVNTEIGDVICVLDRVTGIMGIHAPDKMKVHQVYSYIEYTLTEFVAKDIDPFMPDDSLPLIAEESFIFQQMDV